MMMQMLARNDMGMPAIEKLDQTLLQTVDPDGRLNITACLQCGRCSSGCTMRAETDILPHQLNRMVLLGMKDEVLGSKAIRICISCQTCVSRCPMHVDTPALIDRLHTMAKPADEDLKKVEVFDNVMLASMRNFGRVWEFGMMGVYKLRAFDLFSDLDKFPRMLKKGKFDLFPPVRKGRSAVARIFKRSSQSRRAGR
jgi:heterodisulfide reductase subunit C